MDLEGFFEVGKGLEEVGVDERGVEGGSEVQGLVVEIKGLSGEREGDEFEEENGAGLVEFVAVCGA